MGKKAILFDLDNTLYEYGGPHKKALKAVFGLLKRYVNISYREFFKLYNLSKSEIQRELAGTASAHNRTLYFQRLIEKAKHTVEPLLILKLYNVYWDTLLKNMKLRKGVMQTLKVLHDSGCRIAIVSDLTTNIQLRKIKKLKVGKYVDVLVTSEEAGSEKPHAIMFLLALNKLGVSPKEAMMVGDNAIADVEGANFVGLDTVLLSKGVLARIFKADYRRANYVIKEISELLKILKLEKRRN